MELTTIECVAFFYNEGAKGDDYIQKNKFRCQVDSETWKSVIKLRNVPVNSKLQHPPPGNTPGI